MTPSDTRRSRLASPAAPRLRALAAAAALAAIAAPAAAQVTIKTDGQWRHLVTAGVNLNSGNTESTAINLASDSVRATDSTKWSANAQLLYASTNDKTTGERLLISSQYNTDLFERTFAFVQAEGLRDEPANLSDRYRGTTGLGLHLLSRKDEFFDVWAGVSASHTSYVRPALIDGRLRDSYNDLGLVLAEESNTKFGSTTTLKQKLSILPSLKQEGQFKAEFNGQIAVAMNDRLSLSVGLALRHDSDPAPGLKKLDSALVSGLSLRFD